MVALLDLCGVFCAIVYATNLSKIKLRLVSEFRSRIYRRKKSPSYVHTAQVSQTYLLSRRDRQQHGDRHANRLKLHG